MATIDGDSRAAGVEKIKPFQPRKSGLIRHRLIVGGCALLTVGFLALSTVDFGPLIEREASLNSSFHLKYSPKLPELPNGYVYCQGETPSDGLVKIAQFTWRKPLFGYADTSGRVIIKPQFADARPFHDGLAAIEPHAPQGFGFPSSDFVVGEHVAGESPDEQTADQASDAGKWGFVDTSGRIAIKPRFDSDAQFYNGRAVVQFHGKDALIDKTGRVVFQTPHNGHVQWCGRNFMVMMPHKGVGLIDSDGHWIVETIYDGISALSRDDYLARSLFMDGTDSDSEDLNRWLPLVITKKGLCGLMDQGGKVLLEPNYDDVVSYRNGHAGVVIDGKCGIVDLTGKIVIQPRYDYVTAFDELIAAHKDKKWLFMNSSGEVLPGPAVDGIVCDRSGSWLANGRGPIISKDKVGYVNNKAEVVVKPQFELALPLKRGFAWTWNNGSWRYIDPAGQFASGVKFGTIQSSIDGQTPVTVQGPLYWLVGSREQDQYATNAQNLRRQLMSPRGGLLPGADSDSSD